MDTKASLPEYPLRERAAPPREPFFRRILPFLSRRFWVIASAWIVTGLLINALLHMPGAGYSAAATILLSPRGDATPVDVDERAIWEQTRALGSRALIAEAVDRLDLTHDPNWNVGSQTLPPALDFLAPKLRGFGIALAPNTPQRARAAIIERLQDNVRVERVNSSLVVEVKVTTPVPADSVVLANTLADAFVEDRLQRQMQGAPALFDVRIADRAIEAEKAESPFANLWFLSLAGGLLAALGLASLVDYMDRGIGGAAQAMKKTGRPVIASTPLLRGRDIADLPRHRYADAVIANPRSAYAESLRTLRAALLYAGQGHPAKIVCVTAARHGEGKSTIALALARVAAQAGQRTLLVDCDLRRRPLGRMAGVTPRAGLVEAVSGDFAWKDAIVRDAPSGADLMLIAESYYRPRDFFSAPAIEKLFAEFRDTYDLVILSAPPALSVADTRTISRLSDRTILVAHWRRTPATLLRAAIRLLETTGSDIAGLVLNFVDPRARGRLTEADAAFQAKVAPGLYTS